MTVVLEDLAGNRAFMDVPPHLPCWRVAAIGRPTTVSFDSFTLDDRPTVDVTEYWPTGEQAYWITERGVSAVPIWRQKS